MQIEHKIFEAEIKESNESDLTVTHFISTETKDRGGDIMRAAGMKIRGKPVVLLSHGRGAMGTEPIAKPVWIQQGSYKGKPGVMAKTQFFPDEIGKRLWEKTVNGYMPNWSIGYSVIKSTDVDNFRGRDITEWELLEYSPVGVPMNPDAQTIRKDTDENDQTEILFKIMAEDEEKTADIEEKPYPNEHACRIKDPGQFDRIRRENDKFGKGIDAIWGVKDNKSELQAIRFDKSKFTADEAKKWCKDHDYTCHPFEPAKTKEEDQYLSVDFSLFEGIHEKIQSLEDSVKELQSKIIALSLLPASPDAGAKDEEGQDNNPPGKSKIIPRLKIVDDEKAKAEAKAKNLEALKKLIGDISSQTFIDELNKLRGKVP